MRRIDLCCFAHEAYNLSPDSACTWGSQFVLGLVTVMSRIPVLAGIPSRAQKPVKTLRKLFFCAKGFPNLMIFYVFAQQASKIKRKNNVCLQTTCKTNWETDMFLCFSKERAEPMDNSKKLAHLRKSEAFANKLAKPKVNLSCLQNSLQTCRKARVLQKTVAKPTEHLFVFKQACKTNGKPMLVCKKLAKPKRSHMFLQRLQKHGL